MIENLLNILRIGILLDYWKTFIYFIGIYALSIYLYDNFKSVISIIKSILEPYFQPNSQKSLIEKYGKWAVITGSTDGIGKEYAKELAKRGINVVLISRTEKKLIDVAKEIELEFKVKTKWIVADFAKGKEVYEHIRKELDGIPVGILVNNVGKMYDYPDELAKVPEDILWDLININVAACTMMCRMLIDQMKKNGKGAIVNISSGSELQPLPYMAVYSATKKYVKSLTLALQEELNEYGITVQCVTPLFLVTKMNQYSKKVMSGGFLIPDVKSFTQSAVFTLGRTSETTGYWTHGLQYAISKIVPEWIRMKIGHRITQRLRTEYLNSLVDNKTS
ncbi:inactive hydroxysteroid dehydrogenase-like protein 1 [Episyrphus balteatus]|uniref:inactive hydroxysteroid dehydrogenase-like protein 1 n=1 Tax=Episyrphus balteatus TaxID=286459 RepID=UPI00248636EC|nr:inactive hydroxysteroid dehydrogenase-like protein 1 [Episyrphus balteatus]